MNTFVLWFAGIIFALSAFVFTATFGVELQKRSDNTSAAFFAAVIFSIVALAVFYQIGAAP